MVKKVIFLILSLAIIATGITGFSKLNYWQRSVRIFRIDSGQQQAGRRGPDFRGQMPGNGERMRRELPDSIRQRFERERPDSLFRGSIRPGSGRNEGGGFGRGSGQGERFRSEGGFEGRGREDFRNGRKINFATAGWYLAVFASIVVIVIYIEKAVKLIRGKKQ